MSSSTINTVLTTVQGAVQQLSSASLSRWATIAAAVTASISATRILYSLFLSPLRHLPGPLAWRATNIPWAWNFIRGTLPFRVLDLHERYGPVVRIRPDELSFADPRAWQDIYGHKVAGKMAGLQKGQKELPKYDKFYKRFAKQPTSFLNAPFHEHAVLRRLIAPGFSDRAMREQEPILTSYIDLLLRRLKENMDNGPVNLCEWYNWATFDIMGDLAFGQSFNCLEGTLYHPFVRVIAGNPMYSAVMVSLKYFGLGQLTNLFFFLLTRFGLTARGYAKETLQKRIEAGASRPDLIEPFLEKRQQGEIAQETLQITAVIFIIAGSETTASLLTGATYLMLSHPETLTKATAEVRSAFRSEKDITLAAVQNLPYMIACLTEALRCYPPAATGFPRIVPEGGAVVADHHLPENTVVSVYPWVTHHLDEHWVGSSDYRPERWLGDEKYADDNKDAYKPFSFGPRDCVGKNLSYSEMRLIMARMLWNFDMRLADDSKEWLKDQKCYMLWRKPPLNVHLTLAKHDF